MVETEGSAETLGTKELLGWFDTEGWWDSDGAADSDRAADSDVSITSNCPYFSSNSGVWRISITVSTVKVSATAFVNISWMTPGSWLNSSVATVR